MKQTEYYKLNRWEKPDRILMDDFNADNSKIDAALAAHAAALAANTADISAEKTARITDISGERTTRAAAMAAEESARRTADEALQNSIISTNPIVRLADVTTAYAVNQVNLYIGNINWSTYGEVLLFGRVKSTGSTGLLSVTLDGDTKSTSYTLAIAQTSGDYSAGYTTTGLCFMNVCAATSGFSAHIPFTTFGFFTNWSGLIDASDKSGTSFVNRFSYCSPTSKLRTQYANMNFTCNVPLDAGCRFVLLGVKL